MVLLTYNVAQFSHSVILILASFNFIKIQHFHKLTINKQFLMVVNRHSVITEQKHPKLLLTSPLHFSNSCLHFLTTHCTEQLNYFHCVVLSSL